jgi:hypothetical protein
VNGGGILGDRYHRGIEEIRFLAGEYAVRAIVDTSESSISPFTGRALQKLRVRFMTNSDEPHDVLQQCIDAGVKVLDQNGNESEIWGAQQVQHSTTTDVAGASYIWELTEKETVRAEKLLLGALELTPYHYQEEIDDAALIVTARVELTKETLAQLKALPRYFSVVRKGVSEQPREMRLTTKTLWSRITEEGPFKYELILVEKTFDRKRRQVGWLEPHQWNVEMSSSASKLRLQNLVDLLQTKGVISESEADQLWKLQDAEVRAERHNLDRVADLDEFKSDQAAN